jgi:hypothetical protein
MSDECLACGHETPHERSEYETTHSWCEAITPVRYPCEAHKEYSEECEENDPQDGVAFHCYTLNNECSCTDDARTIASLDAALAAANERAERAEKERTAEHNAATVCRFACRECGLHWTPGPTRGMGPNDYPCPQCQYAAAAGIADATSASLSAALRERDDLKLRATEPYTRPEHERTGLCSGCPPDTGLHREGCGVCGELCPTCLRGQRDAARAALKEVSRELMRVHIDLADYHGDLCKNECDPEEGHGPLCCDLGPVHPKEHVAVIAEREAKE